MASSCVYHILNTNTAIDDIQYCKRDFHNNININTIPLPDDCAVIPDIMGVVL